MPSELARVDARSVTPGNERGMSLVEATVILAVGALLSATLAPTLRNYINEARQAAALKDTQVIATGVSRMLTDVGESFVLQNGAKTSTAAPLAHGAPSHASSNRVDLLVSDGKIPAKYSGIARGAGTDWDAAVNNAAIQKLEYYLVLNTPSNLAANAYRTGATMDGTLGFDPDGASQYNSRFAWRGAYVPGPIGPDPWGYRYAVNVEFLERALGAGPSGQVNDVFVLSAGSNGLVETAFAVDGATSGNDILAIVSGGTR